LSLVKLLREFALGGSDIFCVVTKDGQVV